MGILPKFLFSSLSLSLSLSLPLSAEPYYINTTFFGQDLEFTRHDLFNGISAELIANRKFAMPTEPFTDWPSEVQQLVEEGVVPRWVGIGSPTLDSPYYAMHDDLISGDVGSSIHCAANISKECGIEQGSYFEGFDSGVGFGSSIILSKNMDYTLQLVVKGEASIKVFLSDADAEEYLFSATITSTSNWTTISQTFTSPATTNATLRISALKSSPEWWLGSTSLTPASNTWKGMRIDVVDGLKALKNRGLLRWPGGCFAPFYRWKIGLLPPHERPPIETPPDNCAAVPGGINAYTDGMMENGIGVDDFMALCERIGMVPAITLRLSLGSEEEIEEAADLIEYLNGEANGTKWGRIRASRSRVEPFNVEHVYVGNEIDRQTRYPTYPNSKETIAAASSSEYAEMMSNMIPRILQKSPTIKLKIFAVSANVEVSEGDESARK